MTSWVPCPDCEGNGWFVDSTYLGPGLGELPSDGLIEAVAKVVWKELWRVPTESARAALVAARLWERENA